MSMPTRSPLRMAGAVLTSGNVNTGELNFTLGGAQMVSIYSGMVSGASLAGAPGAVCGVNTAGGADILFYSGAGRLKDIVLHQSLVSGQAIKFYDAPTPTSGGPFAASGHKILAIIPASPPAGLSGSFIAAGMYAFDVPFQSGLCVNLLSGGAGFSISFIPEQNTNQP